MQTLVENSGSLKAVAYTPHPLEKYGDSALASLHCASRLAIYTLPMVAPLAVWRGWATTEGGLIIAQFLFGLCAVSLVAVISRAAGRLTNPVYAAFLQHLHDANTASASLNIKGSTPEIEKCLEVLKRYDFQFNAAPVDFDVREVDTVRSARPSPTSRSRNWWTWFSPTDWMASLLANSFGISLVYPGSMYLMGALLEAPLAEGRTRLVAEHAGQRNKLRTRDNNDIDTMFVRGQTPGNGDTLFICCEGNAGFYELGIMATPVADGYSTLGWNHPGFGGSTGTPFPDQEQNAVDAVMQFAIHRLGFQPQDIIVMGWSIGGYSATWVAMNYPEIKGLILDATFDHLEPLAIPRMPAFASGLVSHAVNHFIDLDVAGQLSAYPGPVTIVRRLRDEMITTSQTCQLELWANRGNFLLVSLLTHRYPELASTSALERLKELLGKPVITTRELTDSNTEQMYQQFLDQEAKEGASRFPSQIGAGLTEDEKVSLLAFLARHYMTDVDTTHCTPLPVGVLATPWNCSHTNNQKQPEEKDGALGVESDSDS